MKRFLSIISLILIVFSTSIIYGEYAARPTYVNRHYFENGTYEVRELDIKEDIFWTKANSPYVVEGKVNVKAQLNIEEGVNVLFSDKTKDIQQVIKVETGGKLNVKGTLGQEVLFASYSEGGNPNFNATSISIYGEGEINHAIFENGSPLGGALNIFSDDVLVENSIFRDSAGHGIFIGGRVDPVIDNIRFEDLNGYGIYQEDINGNPKLSNLSIDNLNQSILVQAHTNYGKAIPLNRGVLWENPSIPYIIDGWIYIGDGGNLNIGSGTKVKFNPIPAYGSNYLLPKQGSIVVENKGKLYADGVEFSLNKTSANRDVSNWGYIYGAFGSIVEIKNSHIQNGGYFEEYDSSKLGSLILNTKDAIIENTIISDGASHGIYIGRSDIEPILENVTLRDNRGYGIYLKENARPKYLNISQRFNDIDGVFLESKALLGNLKWGSTEGPYYLNGKYDVGRTNESMASVLEIEPGAKVYFTSVSNSTGSGISIDKNSGIRVNKNSNIIAKGNLDSPIIFSSGQKNPSSGDWDNIILLDGSSGIFDYCNFEYGGNSSNGMLNLSTSKVAVKNSYFANTSRSAIYLDSTVAPYEISGNQFNLNNNSFGIYKWGDSVNVNAIKNWWNHITGPYNSILNPGGRGTMVSNFINFKPFESNPGGSMETLTSLGSKYGVDKNKKWTIEFNNKLNKDYVNTSYINVIDDEGNFVDINVALDSSSKKVIISPLNNYSSGKKYTLIIKQGIMDLGKSQLFNGLKMDFHIR